MHRFAAPPDGQIYEVWLQRGGVAHPTTALFGVNDNGDAEVDVPGNLHGVSRVMVTREPAGGIAEAHPPGRHLRLAGVIRMRPRPVPTAESN